MADPRQKSIEVPPSLTRILPAWITPMWVEAPRWRQVVRSQPIAIICRDRLITYAQALPWEVRARDVTEQEELADDIRYYQDFVLKDFDLLMDLIWQDSLDLPIGGNVELVRWPPNVKPKIEVDGDVFQVSREWHKGHIFSLVHIDGATLAPTYDPQFPVLQRLPQYQTAPIYFNQNEIRRIVLTPRPEYTLKGYGMPPPQRIYLAISLLFRGDQYYANLLLDTPEAGILDLLDMSQKSAGEWLSSFKTMVEGIDPMKIGVLYEHEQAARWIPFGRPPTDMMFDTVTLRYGKITAAGYWLTLADLGLEGGGSTLAGEIRRQREVRLSGFGLVREKTTNFVNSILPPYLVFGFQEKDDEAMSALGRARLLNAQALKTFRDAGLMTVEEAQEQLKRDGLLSVELVPPKEKPAPALPAPKANGQLVDQEMNRVPPSQGGEGDVGVQRALTESESTEAAQVSVGSRLADILLTAFARVVNKAGLSQFRRLIKAAVRRQFSPAAKALVVLSEADLPLWSAERIKAWFGEPSVFDEFPEVRKADQALLDQLEEILNGDPWWAISEEQAAAIAAILTESYGAGAANAAVDALGLLYEEGVIGSSEVAGFNFELKNPRTLAELNQNAAELVRRVDDGTKYYLKRLVVAGVDEGLSSQEIALQIKEGASLDDIIGDSDFLNSVAQTIRNEIGGMFEGRVESIVNTEINRAETNGRLRQWDKMGLTRKRWAHTGPDVPCPVCRGNIDLGFVAMDYQYTTVFGPETAEGPPGHPRVCHCHLEFDEKELLDKAGSLKVWNGS